MNISIAGFEHLEILAALFDEYRVFYQQPSDVEGARAFLRDRLVHRDSVILIATENTNDSIQEAGKGAGFTQLYPSFSSVSMKPIWILNDLYVNAGFRRQGVARALLERAKDYAVHSGAIRLELSTGVRNTSAQTLYESLDYVRADANPNPDDAFFHYSLSL